MKSITHLLAAAVALAGVFAVAPEAKASKITLDGEFHYKLASKIKFYSKQTAPRQSGRYRNLKKGYYHDVAYGCDFITNNSGNRSGDLSFELWAMPYYGANAGPIIRTTGKDPLKGGKSYTTYTSHGQGISIGKSAFPDINVWEFTRDGWIFRDAYTFKRSNYM